MPRLPLDRARIVDAALQLADEGGLPAVTARTLAERLEVTPMAIYRHVPNLAAVTGSLLDRVLAEARILDHASASLDAFLLETFDRIHGCLVAHPSVLPLLGTAAGYGPAALAVVDGVLARLLAAGISRADAVRAFHVLLSYTIGAASIRAAMRSRPVVPTTAAFEGAPYVRDAVVALGTFASGKSFRSGFATVLAAIELEPEAIRKSSRRRPTSRRAT